MLCELKRNVSLGAHVLNCTRGTTLGLHRARIYSTKQLSTSKNTAGIIDDNGSEYSKKVASVAEISALYKKWFPKDIIGHSQLDKFIQLDKKLQQDIRVGILYDNPQVASSSKIIEALLADPFASGHETWFSNVHHRSRSGNNTFTSLDSPSSEPESDNSTQYSVPSPILSASKKPLYKEAAVERAPLTDFNVFNNIQLIEINDLSQVPDVSTFCHFYIHVTNDFTTGIDRYPLDLKNQILVSVVDNTEYSPTSTESNVPDPILSLKHHVIKVNSSLAYAGIVDFLEHDTEAASRYITSIQQSNLFELLKFVYLHSSSDVLCNWLLIRILNHISDGSTHESAAAAYKNLKSIEIPIFSEQLHSELQYRFIPATTRYFTKKLTWWKLYLRNDNVEYDLKDFFNSHFMNQSIESYNYFRGLIVSQLQQQKYADYSKNTAIDNPILNLKNKLISERIEHEIQPVVFNGIVEAFTFYQLPVSVIALLSFQFFGFSLESAVALGSLGWVLGFNHVSKVWEKFTNRWMTGFFEEVRVVLGKKCIDEGLLKELTNQYKQEQTLTEVKSRVVDELQKNLKNRP